MGNGGKVSAYRNAASGRPLVWCGTGSCPSSAGAHFPPVSPWLCRALVFFPASSLRTSRFFRTLHRKALAGFWITSLSVLLWQQRRRLRTVEVRYDALVQILEHALCLLRTGGDHRPNSLTPTVPLFAARPLRDVSVDDHEADRLLRQIVCRLHSRRGDEPEVAVPKLLESRRDRLGGRRCRAAQRHLHNVFPRRFQLRLELFGRQLFPSVDHPEHAPQSP